MKKLLIAVFVTGTLLATACEVPNWETTESRVKATVVENSGNSVLLEYNGLQCEVYDDDLIDVLEAGDTARVTYRIVKDLDNNKVVSEEIYTNDNDD